MTWALSASDVSFVSATVELNSSASEVAFLVPHWVAAGLGTISAFGTASSGTTSSSAFAAFRLWRGGFGVGGGLRLQSSERHINKGLDLWLAAQIKAGDDTPLDWSSAQEMYSTIDSIQEGSAPFITIDFKYAGPIPSNPPTWMTQTYQLCTRDAQRLLHNQLAITGLPDGGFNERPYRQFNYKGIRVWSNLMSGEWAYTEADMIAKDEQTHGSMLVPIVAGSDKTTVSVATGHQEYHPVYMSPGNFSNITRRAHGDAVLPVAFLPIPKTNKGQRKRLEYQRFVRQMYHMCLARVFAPLRSGMTSPEIVRCPDGHFRRAIYSLGPYIADYPEQVWLAGVVQGWCPKYVAYLDFFVPNNDDRLKVRRRHERTDFMISCFDPSIVWETYGIRSDVVPFTHDFPRADIHTLLSPDLLHQLIKGTFKDHLVTWINDYFHVKYGESRAREIIHDIDLRISAVPLYAGLRRFSEGRDFEQWTGDDSKALMKVYIAAIAGYVPPKMVQCMSAFMNTCYIFRRNSITSAALSTAEALIKQFHELRTIFITEGVRTSISLPRQHALTHYLTSVPLFGSPNGLCSSITESKHIKAVKEPWRRSSRFKALPQMLQTIVRLEKLAALHRKYIQAGTLYGSTAAHFIRAQEDAVKEDSDAMDIDSEDNEDESRNQKNNCGDNGLADAGPDKRAYPKDLITLSQYIQKPDFPHAFKSFLYSIRHPNRPIPENVEMHVSFTGKIHVFHSAIARFYSPSDLCGLSGMYRQRIRSTPSWYGHPRRDTVFIVVDENEAGMRGMLIARIHLLFTFTTDEAVNGSETSQCALVSWFLPTSDEPDLETGMWAVKPEGTQQYQPLQVISLKSIARAFLLLVKLEKAEKRQKAKKQIANLLMQGKGLT
ncbi:hypothetical protein AGABI1DRAFT_101528 [Agaricus bisporus var. burnettii JB137-S8]|uniref:Uncharacterized protein n=1 Tax=Agaricus bisporus var. burnettii (strain JB137-S8 / ATCC MYA-4627 / FGSC 10392) TaxID=597362 RepID=K5X3S1_AGABU|nr:uncharacterized protein AGABI1DRAFT_101528 [Agaricus bisporus var. burnettii JB137-S8]EKM77823.1 hypothetical protein AGABI1DRAFT_101528 [Agaricus bisporus var. burnettii JB137-S8]